MVDLELMKQSLNVFGSHHDALIQHQMMAAKSYVERHIDREILPEDYEGEVTEAQVIIDPTLTQAIMQVTGFFYANRENQEYGKLGGAASSVVDRLLIPYRRF